MADASEMGNADSFFFLSEEKKRNSGCLSIKVLGVF